MKKVFIFLLVFCVMVPDSFSQISPEQINTLKVQLLKARHDSTRMELTYQLAYGFRFSNIDSSLFYSDVTIKYANKLNMPFIKAQMLSLKGAIILEVGKLPESLQLQFEAMEISEKLKDTSNVAFALNRIGNIYMELADYKKANEYYFLSKTYLK